MEYEVNSRPFDEHEMVDDVVDAANALAAAIRFARESGLPYPATVYVRAVGPCKIVTEVTVANTQKHAATGHADVGDVVPVLVRRSGRRMRSTLPDAYHIDRVAFRLHQAAFFAQRPERTSHVRAKEWMTMAFDHGGRIDDFETRVRAVQLLIHFDMFVADCIRERCHERN